MWFDYYLLSTLLYWYNHCPRMYKFTYPRKCETSQNPRKLMQTNIIETTLHVCTLSILCIFLMYH